MVLLGISVLVFVLLHAISSSPGRAVLGVQASAASVAAFNHAHGYDRPLPLQYLSYLGSLLHGDLGYSYKLNQPVTALLGENAGRSAFLSAVSLVLSVVIAVPLGILQAVKRNTVIDNSLTGLAFVLYSIPAFFLGLVLIEFFSLRLNLLPSEASQATTVLGVVADPVSMILPVVTLTAVSVAAFSRYMRSSALDNLAQDYIRVARAKGLTERQVLSRHLLRNSCLPIITLVGLSLPALLAGNLIVETVFNFPGLGLLFFNSLQKEDYPVLMAYSLIVGVLTVLGNLVADVALAFTDPRIRLH
ncbi:peptide/nickel transport system permease protein [Friedmanniella endophytica]|uniref:Peptide/nickel transport system permease protein n=1 Tax=Microlunatus kandeliicorticis TaxID=1759536 RepID=A0A7W3IUW2_9ACTN|nr:peptide/nickel transport system permease protein [Microlunatus kandeliicorticis]